MVNLNISFRKFLKVYIYEIIFFITTFFILNNISKYLSFKLKTLSITNIQSLKVIPFIYLILFLMIILIFVFFVISRKYIYNTIAETRKRLLSYVYTTLILLSLTFFLFVPGFYFLRLFFSGKILLIISQLLFILILNFIYSIYILTAKRGSAKAFLNIQSMMLKRFIDYILITLLMLFLWNFFWFLVKNLNNIVKFLVLIFLFTYHRLIINNTLNRKIVRKKIDNKEKKDLENNTKNNIESSISNNATFSKKNKTKDEKNKKENKE